MSDERKVLPETPSQTAGPYVHIGLTPNFAGIGGVYPFDAGSKLVNKGTHGERTRIYGTVYDGEGEPVKDAVLEIWQADAKGVYWSPQDKRKGDPNFSGWGRVAVDLDTGAWSFDTIKPGPVPLTEDILQAPHVTLWIVARGINVGLQTRIYFDTESRANDKDPLLQRVPAERRDTLIAEVQGDGSYHIDIHLQGERETVFFDI